MLIFYKYGKFNLSQENCLLMILMENKFKLIWIKKYLDSFFNNNSQFQVNQLLTQNRKFYIRKYQKIIQINKIFNKTISMLKIIF